MRNRKPPLHRPPWQETREARLARVHRATEAQRASASARGYDHAWTSLRRRFIAAHPWCAMCAAEGRERRAEVVDHVQGVKEAPHLRLDPGNLRSLCRAHHTRRTASDPRQGGFGRRKGD
jgi:5-methylcytosine-specific restriction protein A